MKSQAFTAAYLFAVALIITVVFFAATSRASYGADSIAVVDVQNIMDNSKAATSIREQVKKKQTAFQKELDEKEKELQTQDQELAKQRNILSKEAFEKQYKEFREKAVEAQKQIREKKKELDQTFGQALNKIQKKIADIVADISKDKGVEVTIARSQVIYAGGAIDITDEVLKRLDSDMPKVEMSF